MIKRFVLMMDASSSTGREDTCPADILARQLQREGIAAERLNSWFASVFVGEVH